MANIKLKRVYETAAGDDGFRVLVDRLWPRGVSKDNAKLDAWLKEIGPSNELRKWFGHDPAKFEQFCQRYEKELAGSAALAELRNIAANHPTITLLYGAKDSEHNQARVLAELLK